MRLSSLPSKQPAADAEWTDLKGTALIPQGFIFPQNRQRIYLKSSGSYTTRKELPKSIFRVDLLNSRNKCIATSNKCLTSSNKCLTTSNKKLLETRVNLWEV